MALKVRQSIWRPRAQAHTTTTHPYHKANTDADASANALNGAGGFRSRGTKHRVGRISRHRTPAWASLLLTRDELRTSLGSLVWAQFHPTPL